MADLDNDRTVVVDRDTRDASSPLGWIVLLIVLLLAIMFFLTNGFGLFGSEGSDTTQIETPTTTENLENDTLPIENNQNDAQSDPTTAPDGSAEPAPDTAN